MNITKIFDHLFHRYGHQHWWPVQGGLRGDQYDYLFEICVGAILTQNTAWLNVEKALKCLVENNLMNPQAILGCSAAKLQRCVRPSGYFKQKTKKLKIFSRWLIKNYQGGLKKFFQKPLKDCRKELLNLWGIGPETADSILLYAGGKPIFGIDAYTKRLCNKYGVRFKTYGEYQNFFESYFDKNFKKIKKKLPPSCRSKTKLYNEFHALMVRWGKEEKNFRF